MSSLRVESYGQTLEAYRGARESGKLTPEVESMFEEQLDELWSELTVSEVREIEERYPDLKVRKFG